MQQNWTSCELWKLSFLLFFLFSFFSSSFCKEKEILKTKIGGRLMCTNKCAQAESHFSVLGASWAITRTKIKKQQIIKWESALPESFCNFFALSEMRQFLRKVQKCNFFADRFRKWENSLGTNIEHMQSRCMAGSTKKLSFLAIFCSAACARLLVHVRCPMNFLKANKNKKTWT